MPAALAGVHAAKKNTHAKGMGAPDYMVFKDENAEKRRLRNIVKQRIRAIFNSGENLSDPELLDWHYADDNGKRINVEKEDIQSVINQVRNERNPYLNKVNPAFGYATGDETGPSPFFKPFSRFFGKRNMNE